jgi:hypothetical protein
LPKWFKEFGSTQCRAPTGCDFASTADVRAYVANDGTGSCAHIAERVAARVAELIERPSASEQASAPDETPAGIPTRPSSA